MNRTLRRITAKKRLTKKDPQCRGEEKHAAERISRDQMGEKISSREDCTKSRKNRRLDGNRREGQIADCLDISKAKNYPKNQLGSGWKWGGVGPGKHIFREEDLTWKKPLQRLDKTGQSGLPPGSSENSRDREKFRKSAEATSGLALTGVGHIDPVQRKEDIQERPVPL